MKLLSPFPFFVGLILGLAALSSIGSYAWRQTPMGDFVRFHRSIGVETNYFASTGQVDSLIEAVESASPKVIVIVGGSSVFNGVGQRPEALWSKRLANLLGPDFAVLNLAQRAGGSGEFGSAAAELLIKRKRPVIYVADASIATFNNPLSTAWYRDFLFTAWHRDWLLPWPPRDKLLAEAAWHGDPVLRTTAISAALDRVFRFRDFWNAVSWCCFGTVWSKGLAYSSFKPRRSLPDPEMTPAQLAHMWTLVTPADIEKTVRSVRTEIMPRSASHITRQAYWIEHLAPAELRAVTLLSVRTSSPYFTDRLAPVEHEQFRRQIGEQRDWLKAFGFDTVLAPGASLAASDYVDRVHLSDAGAHKLAEEIAPHVREMAIRFGYIR
jgi:hypothetical protein